MDEKYPIQGDPTPLIEKRYTIYLHRNLLNNKVYIGQTCMKPEKRWGKNGDGYKKQPYFYNAIQKYGWENFEHKVLMSNLSQEKANQAEQYWIKFFNANNTDFGYNLTAGGQGSFSLSKEAYNRKQQKLKEYWGSEEGKAQAKKHSLEILGKNNPMYGKHHTNETKKKISLANSGVNNGNYGKHFSNEHRRKISEANKGKNGKCGLANGHAKPVYCHETQKFYETGKEASRQLNMSYKTLQRYLKNEIASAKGYHFRYATNEEIQRLREGKL